MAKDPAFLFYPGDYLRDTQCLSEKTQVAYDRIMCEHMRNTSTDMNNIFISQDKVNFFTKRLNEDEKQELFTVLEQVPGGFQIHWVAESIADRRLYSESRSKNRSKKDESHENTSLHMEDGNGNEEENKKKEELLIPKMFAAFKKVVPKYPGSSDMDFQPLGKISNFLLKQLKLKGDTITNKDAIIKEWTVLCGLIAKNDFYKIKPLSVIANQIQGVWQLKDKKAGASTTGMVEAPSKGKKYYQKNR